MTLNLSNALARAAAAALLALALSGPLAHAAVRPISAAERGAAQIGAGYLSRGPEAVFEELSSRSPLRALPRQEALDEIETRFGPHHGATWELETVVAALEGRTAVFNIAYPSGIDEEIIIDLVQENGVFKIYDARVLAQRSPQARIFPKVSKDGVPQREDTGIARVPVAAGVLAALLAVCASFLRRRSLFGSRLAILASAIGILTGLAFIVADERRGPSAKSREPVAAAAPKPGMVRLASLLPLRRALAAGQAEVDSMFERVGKVGVCGEVASLWKAQHDLQQMRVDEAKRTLSRFESPAEIPLVEILRARLGLLENDEVTAAIGYENAINLGPGRDALWYEAAQALAVLGFDDRAAGYLVRLSRIGSRRPGVYYSLAIHAASKNLEEDAEKHLRHAWKLQPAERAQLIGAGGLWSVIRRPAVAQTITLASASEAAFAGENVSRRAITLPPDAQAEICGDSLRIQIGEQELLIPGGVELAPVGTAVADAGSWNRSQEEKGLKDLPQLLSVQRNAGAYTQPALRQRITRAGTSLAARNRWSELLELTDGLTPSSEHVPADLFFLRDIALQRTQRHEEARRLLLDLASSKVLQRRRDARALYELGEMLGSFDLFDDAIRMLDRSQAIRPNGSIDERVRQLEMNRRLATKYDTYTTPHFEIHFPEDVSTGFAHQIGSVLESEYQRLQQWVPVANPRPVVVNILWWDEFRATYTGSDFILGFYQGKITIPFAGVGRLVPEVVTILSHELAHALIAQATNDQSPRWFQEGLAQRIEMSPSHANAFNMYDDDKLLAVSLLDAVIRDSPDPDMIREAYIEAQTVIRYIEARYGMAGVKKLIAAFRDGAGTSEAIKQLTGRSIAAFDIELRAWGRSESRVFENPEPVRYDVSPNEEIQWSKQSKESGR